jgi:hypothetical protein
MKIICYKGNISKPKLHDDASTIGMKWLANRLINTHISFLFENIKLLAKEEATHTSDTEPEQDRQNHKRESTQERIQRTEPEL